MNTKLKPIPELDNLPDEKRDLLHDWIEHLGYRKTLEKLQSEWQLAVTYNKLFRYYHRHLKKSAIGSLLEDQLSMSDFLAILNGEPVPYDQTGIELIMKRAFDTACARDINPSTLATLLRVFHYKTNREWNQRRLAQTDERIEISDRLAKVREQELELNKPKPDQSEEEEAARFSAILDQVFRNHPAVKASEKASESFRTELPSDTLVDSGPQHIESPCPSIVPVQQSKAHPDSCDSLIDTGIHAGVPANLNAPGVSTSPCLPDLSPSSPVSPVPGAHLSTNPTIHLSTNPSTPSSANSASDSAIHQSGQVHAAAAARSAVASHTLRRWLAHTPRPPRSPEPDSSWTDECPCGAKLPCRSHGQLWRELRYTKPWDPDYSGALARAGIPYIPPSVPNPNLFAPPPLNPR